MNKQYKITANKINVHVWKTSRENHVGIGFLPKEGVLHELKRWMQDASDFSIPLKNLFPFTYTSRSPDFPRKPSRKFRLKEKRSNVMISHQTYI